MIIEQIRREFPVQIEEIKKVVVRGTNWVGDAAMSIPALRELRRVLPAAEITVCTRKSLIGLFADADFADDVLIYEKQNSAVQTVRTQAKIWRDRKFDLAVLFPNSFESALVARLGKARNRIGYRTDGRGFLLTDSFRVPAWKTERHEVFYYLNLIAHIEKRLTGASDVFEREPNIDLNVSEPRKAAARQLLNENGADLSKRIVALCPGSTNSRAKRWQTQSYAKLADLLKQNLNAEVVLIGAPDESEVSHEVLRQCESKPILVTGKTDLASAVAVLSVCDLLVTNDTGPAHLAPAVGTRTIVIFGPTVPTTTRPFSDLASIIRKLPACAPCMLRDCPIDHRCMSAITPHEVFAAVTEINRR